MSHTSQISALESEGSVAPFRAWRADQHIVARRPVWATIEWVILMVFSNFSYVNFSLMYLFYRLKIKLYRFL